MNIGDKPQRKGESDIFATYSRLIVIVGFVSAFITVAIRQFSALSTQDEEFLVETIAETTVLTLISLMALIGIFVVFWLQIHQRESRSSGVGFSQEFYTGFDQAYPASPSDLLKKAMVMRRMHQEVVQNRMWKVQDFKKRSHYLLSLMVTISILSYFLLFMRFLSFNIMKEGLFANLKLVFSIFIIVLCIWTFFLILQFITSVVQDQE